MNYNKNFAKWITCLILGMFCMSVTFSLMAAGIVINIIQGDWTFTQTMLLIASGICMLLCLACLSVASSAEMEWEYESKNKSEK